MKHSIAYKIVLKSPLATSTGSNDFLVDADVMTDQKGIPYINQRRIKGLLKEYVKEVLEICGSVNDRDDILNHMFGEIGNHLHSAALETEDAFIEKYADCIGTIGKSKIPKSFVKKYFTKVIQQTAIDKNNHTAKKHSLRKIRAVKENVVFTSKISVEDEKLKDIVALALLQWNLMGTQRNEGLGSVKIEFELPKNIDDLVESVNTYEIVKSSNEPIPEPVPLQKYGEKIELTIALQNKLILSRVQGDENIVNSRSVIDGRVLWGFFAGEYIKRKGVDESFEKIFNQGKVKFSSAFPKPDSTVGTFIPMPFHIQFEKNKTKLQPINIFTEKTKEKTKAKSDYVFNNHLYEVPKTISFHLNRENNRLAGTSTDGEIFYYEAIEKGQTFAATLEGENALVNELLITVFQGRDAIDGKIGRSKSVEYGKVTLSAKNVTPESHPNNGFQLVKSFTFYFTSPCIVVNSNGFAVPNIENLERALGEVGIKGTVKKAVCRHEERQHFSGVWKSKTTLQHCFEVGSAFEVELAEETPLNQIKEQLSQGIGLDNHIGMGNAEVYQEDIESYQYFKNDLNPQNENRQNPSNDHKIAAEWASHKDFGGVRLAAIEMGKKYETDSITNGQLSFVNTMLQKYRTWDEFYNYYETIKQRPIGEILKEKINIQHIHKYQETVKENDAKFFEFLRQYLKICRLINNQKNQAKSNGNGK